MPEFPRSDFRLNVGWRNIKTSVTAMLAAMIYCLIGRNPAFACIGVIVALLVNHFLPQERVVALWEGFKKAHRHRKVNYGAAAHGFVRQRRLILCRFFSNRAVHATIGKKQNRGEPFWIFMVPSARPARSRTSCGGWWTPV